MRFKELFDATQKRNWRCSCADDIFASIADLGLWDAEILEFQSVIDAEGFEHEWHQVDGDAWAGNRALEAFGGPVATRVGQRVRTIVLKEEEKNG